MSCSVEKFEQQICKQVIQYLLTLCLSHKFLHWIFQFLLLKYIDCNANLGTDSTDLSQCLTHLSPRLIMHKYLTSIISHYAFLYCLHPISKLFHNILFYSSSQPTTIRIRATDQLTFIIRLSINLFKYEGLLIRILDQLFQIFIELVSLAI